MKPEDNDIRKKFLAWQCLVRQRAMRVGDGRPTEGMRPNVSLVDGQNFSEPVTLLLIHASPSEDIAQFRHMVRKTHDPADRYKAAIKFLSSTYYQRANEFSDQLTGSFSPNSLLARALRASGACRLDFTQFGSRFKMECRVELLKADSDSYQATYWHNALFNPRIPPDLTVLGFSPRWDSATLEEGLRAS
ncbi:hypothetical protein ACYVU7_02015 [Arenicellales bacterium IMCC56312]